MIPSSVFLVIVVITGAPFPTDTHNTVQEVPTMRMCESIGEWVSRAASVPPNKRYTVTYTCIEGARDE